MVIDKRQFYTIETLSEHMAESPEGFLYCYDVPIARTGDQIYKADEVPVEPNNQGLVTIKRDETEVFNENTIKSFEGKPVTIDHPDTMVTSENWKDLAHGFVQNIRRGIREQADLLLGDIVITTKQAIELVKNGLRQVSCGYDAEYEQIEKGLGKQVDIIGNHIALVMRGRAGVRCVIGDKECSNCGKCKIIIQEDKMGIKKRFKDALMKALDAIPDDETDEEKKKVAEAKDAEAAKVEELKALDKKSKDQEEGMSEEGKEKEKVKDEETAKVEELKALDRKAKDIEAAEAAKAVDQEEGEECNCMEELTSKIAALEATIATMQKALEALVASDKEVHSSLDEEGARIEEDLKKDLQAGVQDSGTKDAWECQTVDEKKAAKDCDSVWADVAYRAELLCPGIKLRKPTKDHVKSLSAIKVIALKSAFTSDKDIESFAKGKDIDKFSKDVLDMAFVGASEVIRVKNNKSVRDSIFVKTSGAVSDVQAINKMNKERYGKK